MLMSPPVGVVTPVVTGASALGPLPAGSSLMVPSAGAVPVVVLEELDVSTVQVRVASVGSEFPPAVARAENVCIPSVRLPYCCGDVQPPQLPESSLHWNVEPASLESNVKAADV